MSKEHFQDIELPLLDKSSKAPKASSSGPDYNSLGAFLDIANDPSKFRPLTSWLKYLTFYDQLPTLKKINASKKKITVDEVPPPYFHQNVPKDAVTLDLHWEEELKTGKPSILRALYKTFRYQIWRAGIVTFLVCNVYMVDTFLLGSITSMVSEISLGTVDNKEAAFILGAGFSFSFVAKILLESYFFYCHQQTTVSMRLSIIGLIYKKLNCVSMTALHKLNIGKVINLMANDLNEIDGGATSLWPMILGPYNIIVCCYLMSRSFGYYSILAFFLVLGSLRATTAIAQRSKKNKQSKNLITDARIKHTNELIEAIRLIKIYAWEKPICKIISALRIQELDYLKKIGTNDALNRAIAEASVYIVILVLIVVYVLNGGVLSPDKIFATISILNFMRRRVLMNWTSGRNFLVSAKLLRQRVEELLLIEDITSLKAIVDAQKNNDNTTPIIMQNYSASWGEDLSQPCLKNITTEIPRGKLTVVIGTIGSGKTTFLQAFLKEIPTVSGIMNCSGSIAYVEQEPIVFSQSIRDNILFGQPYDDEFYRKVLLACNLDEDLIQFDHGDQTLVGERGVTLSGGQKARLSLARALYSQSDIYLLDDPLSAVDSRVAHHIFEKAIKGILKDKTVILVTHHLNFAKQGDKVIVFNKGEVEGQGTFEQVQRLKINLLNLFIKDNKGKAGEDGRKKSSVAHQELKLVEKKQEFKRDDTRPVTWDTYRNYIKSSTKHWYGWAALFCVIFAHFCVVGMTRLLGYWADDHVKAFHESQINGTPYEFDNTFYLLSSISLLGIIVLGIYLKGVFMIKFMLDINQSIHKRLLESISKAVVSFFDKTPVGRILTRFSTNMGAIDKDLWGNVYNVINGIFQNALFLFYIASSNILLFIPTVIIFYGFFRVRNFFAKPLREMKQLDLATRSPMYSEISSTLNGLLIIRVYRQGVRFIQRFMDLMYNSAKVILFHQRSERLFSVSLFALLYCLAMSGTFIFLYNAVYKGVEPGLFGMALYYLIVIGSNSILTTRQSLQITISMQHAENVFQYCEVEQEPKPSPHDKDSLLDRYNEGIWPPHGEIVFKEVYLKYPGTNNYALCGVDFKIPAGSKVGIVGRTGAGKSSMIQALFRMVEIENMPTSYIKIDDVNTKDISLDFLRKNLCIIPQTPVIFTGTIRRNLDPFEEYPDNVLWKVLEQVKLKEYVDSLPKKLETEIGINSSVFSAGQKQLICLARVILKKRKIMVLDEATANVDYQTDNFVQEQIMTLFADCTILTIAHRLTTIAHYDKIMVLDKGRVVEYDHPYKLLVANVGDKRISNENGIFARMVKKNGAKVSMNILKTAYMNYFKIEMKSPEKFKAD